MCLNLKFSCACVLHIMVTLFFEKCVNKGFKFLSVHTQNSTVWNELPFGLLRGETDSTAWTPQRGFCWGKHSRFPFHLPVNSGDLPFTVLTHTHAHTLAISFTVVLAGILAAHTYNKGGACVHVCVSDRSSLSPVCETAFLVELSVILLWLNQSQQIHQHCYVL